MAKSDSGSDRQSGPTNLRTLLTRLAKDHQDHLKLCNLLEEIADSLPHEVDKSKCQTAINALIQRGQVHHALEETVLFPQMLALAGNDQDLRSTLSRLIDEHRTDEGHSDEVIELLGTLFANKRLENAEAAGYLLRGLFEGLRRHIAFENEHVLPKARELAAGSASGV
ncbi:MAG: hemerythrin domain-containing protein [Alphaproteobacteria bacterium]|nr:hemerythrin domain-containing protein [Alphaproteobacteria bacterium]